ncbi:MAG: methyltransferase domain-containing protein [Phycisphaerales bacterium]|nr:methyltransferase domain-containing protein [Phycisphaerales bacterium]
MTEPIPNSYVTRAGFKLEAALIAFNVDVSGLVCADLGSHAGGFVDCLLQHGAGKVYSIDTSYGTLAWKLRRDPRVVVMERTNAMHATLPEPVDLVTVDVGWTRQEHVLPNVARMLKPSGRVITLVKPHYEAEPSLLVDGVLAPDHVESVVSLIIGRIKSGGWSVLTRVESPLSGHGGNREVLLSLERA